jgi:hypothetical protein
MMQIGLPYGIWLLQGWPLAETFSWPEFPLDSLAQFGCSSGSWAVVDMASSVADDGKRRRDGSWSRIRLYGNWQRRAMSRRIVCSLCGRQQDYGDGVGAATGCDWAPD